MVLITKQNLVNLNHQNNRFIVKITKSKYLDQDTGDGLQPNHYHCIENRQSAAWFGYILREIDKCSWVLIDLNTSERNVTAGSVLAQGLVDLQNSCLVIDTIWHIPRQLQFAPWWRVLCHE